MPETPPAETDVADETVTAIIPYSEEYTPERMLDEAVESVQNQAVVDTEVIVVEDDEQRGPAWARNTGLDRAETRYVSFLDADDIWKETKLVDQLRLMRRTGAGMCVDGETDYSPVEFAGALLTSETFGLTSSITIDTEVVDARFDESLERREDHLYMIEAAVQGGICFLPETFITRTHEDGLSFHVDTSENQIEEFFRYVVSIVPEAKRYRDPYYQTAYVNLGRNEHFDGEYSAAVGYFLKSLRHGPNINAFGALGITLLTAAYDYPAQSLRRLAAGGTHE